MSDMIKPVIDQFKFNSMVLPSAWGVWWCAGTRWIR